MEFERAMYRVYERSLSWDDGDDDAEAFEVGEDGVRRRVRRNSAAKGCATCERTLCAMFAILVTLTAAMHSTFVGSSGCLERALTVAGVPAGSVAELQQYSRAGDGAPVDGSGDGSESDSGVNGTAASPFLSSVVLRLQILPDTGTDEDLIGLAALAVAHAAMGQGTGPDGEFEWQYDFAVESGVLALPAAMREEHGFATLNVSVPAFCGGVPGVLATIVDFVTGYDTLVINQLMFGLRSDGTLYNRATTENWMWDYTATDPPLGGGAVGFVFHRVLVLVFGCLSFFFVSAVTAILVRTFISSGVALVWPLWHLLRRMQLRVVSLATLTASYPWIGLHFEALRARRKPTRALIMAHMMLLLCAYLTYEACQMAFATWFFGKSIPMGLQVGIFAVFMVSEYFAMVFCRSAVSIRMFPRVVFALYLVFEAYFYAVPYGVFVGVLGCEFFGLLVVMTHLVRVYEAPALRNTVVTPERPRVYTNRLSVPLLPTDLPGLWTLFLPLNTRMLALYEQAVPGRPGAAAAAPGGVAAAASVGGGGDGGVGDIGGGDGDEEAGATGASGGEGGSVAVNIGESGRRRPSRAGDADGDTQLSRPLLV